MVREGGFEPPRLSAPPPQDGVSASSTTPAMTRALIDPPVQPEEEKPAFPWPVVLPEPPAVRLGRLPRLGDRLAPESPPALPERPVPLPQPAHRPGPTDRPFPGAGSPESPG